MPPPLAAISVVLLGHANEARDNRYRRSQYAARGITEYWIVNPQHNQVALLSLIAGYYDEAV